MPRPRFRDHKTHFNRLIQASLRAADPHRAVAQAMKIQGRRLAIGDASVPIQPDSRIWIVAFGKASAAMCRAALERLNGLDTAGVMVIPEGSEIDPHPGIEVIHGGHPLPTSGSLRAGQAVAQMLQKTRPQDLVLTLISGGGSALLELPIAGVSLADLRWLNERLLASGASIETINLVRKAYSQIKGGGLLRLAAPARVAALILSDVIGDDPAAIASGPATPHTDPRPQARKVLASLGLWETLPEALREALDRRGTETPIRPPLCQVIIGSNRTALAAAQAEAERMGFLVQIEDQPLLGEARDAGARIAAQMRIHAAGIRQPICLLYGGETTVTLDDHGKGGRNQELALAAAVDLAGLDGVVLMAFASDGVDGPTDAAGAIVTGRTIEQIQAQGLDPFAHLQRHDSYPALAAVHALIRTGPTGTNVNDLAAGLLYPLRERARHPRRQV